MKIIELLNITKKYNGNIIIDNISYSFEEGKSYLLIGNNGSGKTTLIKGILGLIKFDRGYKFLKYKKVGYVPEKIVFPDYITVYDFLINLGSIRRITKQLLKDKINKLLVEWKLINASSKKMKDLSKGMYQKVLIIQALIDDYDLYIFDEALNGLDISMQKKFIKLVKELMKRNKTIIICTHYPKYYSKVCDYTLSIENGKLNEKLS